MNAPANIHWTENAELLERFVLHRLKPAERHELEAHLHGCKKCQKAVRAEEGLVAGLRRVGRDELKAKLKQRLEIAYSEEADVRHRRPAWTWQIATAAATIVLLIGIGIYGRWFTFREEKQIEPSQVGDIENRSSQTAAEETGKDRGGSGTQTGIRPTAPARTPPPVSADHILRDRDERSRGEESLRDKFAQKKLADENPLPAANEAGAGAAERREQSNPNEKELRSERFAGVRTFWIEGNLLESPKNFAAKQAEQSAKSNVTLEKAQNYRLTVKQDGNTQIVSLNQQTNDALPSSRKARQTQLQGGKVQTLVERKDEVLTMTLYLDVPVEESELQEATIQPVNEDSLIVNLKNQRIGYRIPGGWNTQGGIKTKVR